MKLARVVVGSGCFLIGWYAVPALAQGLDIESSQAVVGDTQETVRSRETSTTELTSVPVPRADVGQSESLWDELEEFENAKQNLVASEAEAVSADSQDSESESEEDGINQDLRVPLRGAVGYSSSGPGFDGFGQFEGFIPVWQELGEGVVFLETRLLIDNGAHLGGNILLGGRDYSSDRNQILGGYASFDTRSTGESTFYQLGFGVERLARWDLRANAYVPIGNTSSEISDSGFFDSGSTATAGFAGRQLVLTNEIEQTRITRDEVALIALDLEAGGTIARWKVGDLRAYAGTYAYVANEDVGVPTTFGWRVRLDARPQPHLMLGLAVQGDELFGTNVVATVGATFRGLRPRRELDEQERVIARLREPVARNNAITVDTVTDSEQQFREESTPLFNPEEEEPYRFTHVTLGGSGGDGTFESPFGTVEDALQATVGDGNDIVYVDGEAEVPIPAFTIPDNVRVLSQGPEQQIAGLPFPGFPSGTARFPFNPEPEFDGGIIVDVPLSGDGFFPTITGGGDDLVTLSDNTVLAGFQLEDAPQNAIVASDVTNVELRNNSITFAGANTANGINLENVSGNAILFDNSVVGAGDRGIVVENNTPGEVEVRIAGYQLEGNSVGFEAIADDLGSQIFDVGPSSDDNTSSGVAPGTTLDNEITGNDNEGIILEASNFGSQEFFFTDGTITDNGAGGVVITAVDGGLQQPLSFINSTISDNGGIGIEVTGGVPADTTTFVSQELIVNNSEIARNQGDGISIAGFGVAIQGFSFGNSSIVDNQGAGIRSTVEGNAQQEFNPATGGFDLGIGNNIITGNAEEGITISLGDGTNVNSALLFADIEGNTLEDNGGAEDIVVTAVDTNASACVFIADNTVPSGIALSIDAPPALFEVQDLPNFFDAGSNTSPTNGFAPVTLNPDESEFVTPSGDGVCFSN